MAVKGYKDTNGEQQYSGRLWCVNVLRTKFHSDEYYKTGTKQGNAGGLLEGERRLVLFPVEYQFEIILSYFEFFYYTRTFLVCRFCSRSSQRTHWKEY